MKLIGLDCATQDAKVGVAVGEYRAGKVHVAWAKAGTKAASARAALERELTDATDALIAIDAPLGWPQSLPMELAHHRAGELVRTHPDELFSRETDRSVRALLKTKRPLEVGADRIARTAHATLALLDGLRTATGHAIPLAWSHNLLSGVSAIEVYPAATLLAHGFIASGYKKKRELRAAIAEGLSGEMVLPADRDPLLTNADALDAVVCLLAAQDFLEGKAVGPKDGRSAQKEGWIWVRPLKRGH